MGRPALPAGLAFDIMPAVRALKVVQRRTAAVCDRVHAAVAAELGAGLEAAARRAHRELDAEGARALARDPAGTPECAAGCSHCCHVHVDASRGEILAIAAELTAKRSVEELASLVERLAQRVRLVASMSDEERWRARIPCALLGANGMCTVYDVRPLRCRAFHSCSADVCREAFAGDTEPVAPTNAALLRACEAAELGYERALEEHGLSAAPTSLEAGLFEALRDRGTQ